MHHNPTLRQKQGKTKKQKQNIAKAEGKTK